MSSQTLSFFLYFAVSLFYHEHEKAFKPPVSLSLSLKDFEIDCMVQRPSVGQLARKITAFQVVEPSKRDRFDIWDLNSSFWKYGSTGASETLQDPTPPKIAKSAGLPEQMATVGLYI